MTRSLAKKDRKNPKPITEEESNRAENSVAFFDFLAKKAENLYFL